MKSRILLAILAGLGVLAAGCTSGSPTAQASQAPTTKAGGPPCYQRVDGNFNAWWLYDEAQTTVWVDVAGYVPFPPTPSGRACTVPNMNVHPGVLPPQTKPSTTLFTLTAVYQNGQDVGLTFTAEDHSRYVAYYDFDGTLYRFIRGNALVFTPCPGWAQG